MVGCLRQEDRCQGVRLCHICNGGLEHIGGDRGVCTEPKREESCRCDDTLHKIDWKDTMLEGTELMSG